MKETLFILLVVAVLVGLSMIRYRRQITAAIRFYRILRGQLNQQPQKNQQVRCSRSSDATELVSCARCGRWVPMTESIKIPGGIVLCSLDCDNKTTARKRHAG